MIDVLSGPTWAALALLVLAGAPKVLRPGDTANAVRAALPRVPRPAAAVRALGAVETVVGVAGLLTGHRALLVAAAVSYLGFTAFVVHARRLSTPLSSCGCFGGVDTPPTRLHVVTTAALAVGLAAAAVLARPLPGPVTTAGLPAAVAADPVRALVAAGFAAILCYLLYLVLAVLPTVGAVPRQRSSFQLTGGPA